MQDEIKRILDDNLSKVSESQQEAVQKELEVMCSKIVLMELRDLTDLADPFMREEADKRIAQIENYLDPLGRVLSYKEVGDE